jgi:hypothetical protein
MSIYHQHYKMSTVALLGGSDGDSGASTINAKKRRWRAPREAMPEIQERSPSTLKTLTVGPLGGADGDPRAPIINVKKHRWQAPWEAVTEIHECPPATLKNIDGGPPGR